MNCKYTAEQKKELIRLFDERTVTTREFAKTHKVAISILYKWKKDCNKQRTRNVNLRDVQHMQKRIKFLEDAIKLLHDSAILQHASSKARLNEMRRFKDRYSVHCLSYAFGVSRGTYYNDLFRAKREDSWFQKRRRELEPTIRAIHEDSHGSYGAEKIAAVMRLKGLTVAPQTVAAIMHEMGIVSNRNASYKSYKTARDRYKAEIREKEARFTEDAPNKLWVCDVTQIDFKKIRLYLCVIIDVFSRKVVGWKVGYSNCTRLVKATFLKAYGERKPDAGLVFHSDRGSANISRRFYDCLRVRQTSLSLSRPHVPTDNPVVESFFRSFKCETIYPCHYHTLDSLLAGIDKYMDAYNGLRPHKFLENKTPNMAEEEYFAKHPVNNS